MNSLETTMSKKQDHLKIINQWVERDLAQESSEGSLSKAFEVDGILDQLTECILSRRNPIITGESGIGKTSIIHELVRRIESGKTLVDLQGYQVLQLSLRQRASGLKQPNSQMRSEMQKLVTAFLDSNCNIIPYFRDLHLAYTFHLEPQLQLLAFQLAVPILAEGERKTIQSMLEETPELCQQFLPINIEEPSLTTARRILELWSEEQQKQSRLDFSPDALEEALYLSHRFLARDRLPRKALDLLTHAGSLVEDGRTITGANVIARFCSHHRVPDLLIDPALPLELQDLEARFRDAVLGQEEAIKAMVQMISLIKSGLSDMRRPFGAFLFVGPTGVGKTHLAQFLAEVLFGSRDRIARLNMADYPLERHAQLLFGDPDDHRPAQIRGLLTRRISGQPFAVLLLDEFEKAHPKVHDRFLQLIDEGAFINGAGETVSCRSMIIIMTSNTGAEVYRGRTIGFNPTGDLASMDREVDRRLTETFRFEFLNRFDRVVHFHPLSRNHIRTIALRELEQLKQRVGFNQRRLFLDVDESVLDWITVHGYDPDYGARFLRRMIERHVTTAISDTIVRDNPGPEDTIELSVRRNRIRASLQSKLSTSQTKPRQTVVLPVGTTKKMRNLNLNQMIVEARALVDAAANRLAELENDRREAADLLAQINEPEFWDRIEYREEVLERYRALDVAIRMRKRFAEPILHLSELLENNTPAPANLSPELERAANSLRQWEDCLAEEGHAEVWMVLSTSDPLKPAGQWIRKLANMELAWSRKIGLTASVAAYSIAEGELNRAVLEIEGPGAEIYLTMEHGIHRLHFPRAKDSKVRVEILPNRPSKDNSRGDIRAIKHRRGEFNMELRCKGRVEIENRGYIVELFAENESVLSRMLPGLARAWSKQPAEVDVSRIYGKDGVIHDPRTGVTSNRIKEVWKGGLNEFLEGWRRTKG
jgi:ATP-dependent Clp protease ATP-binding subunit ClpA